MRVTAMDLGTSNTCVTRCDGGPVEVLRPEGWHNPALGGAVPSLILYRDGEPFLIGAAAEYEFGESAELSGAIAGERARYTLRSQFKPDIAVREEARQWMVDFLRLLASRLPAGMDKTGRLLVGIPCQAENHYQQTLRRCLTEAGWEDARFLREPLGAIIHYIAAGVLPPSLAARGVLTVDFGGGTCDLAMLRRADVVSRHGDMLYGGRLFDDLFYQLLLARNPDLEDELKAEGNAYYVHWVACRRAKEDFSAAMQADRTKPVTVRVRWSRWDGGAGRECAAYIEHLSWEDFLSAAGSYIATPELLATLRDHGQWAGLSTRALGLLSGKRVDLIAWFEDILLTTLGGARQQGEQGRGAGSVVGSAGLLASTGLGQGPLADMPLVLLTGGSSAWPFVRDMVEQTLGPRVRVLIGDEPYADIAKGLAQYHVLSEHLREGRGALQSELPSFMEERIRRRAIRQTLTQGSAEVLAELTDFLRSVILIPQFQAYREEGGALRTLMESIATATRTQEGRVRGLLDDAARRLGRRVVDECRAELKLWFREKGIPIVPERLEQTWLAMEMDSFVARMAEQLGGATLEQGRTAAALSALLAAPGLAALAASATPLAAVAVGVGGLVVMKMFKLDNWVVDKSLLLPLPGFVRKRIFAESRLESMCTEQLEAFGKQFSQQIIEEWGMAEGRILAEAERVAKEEIEALDILNITPA